ncbi:MAG TPA: phage holin family protein [Chthoniobacteraceae bacterium]|jgi:putative membrane protein|nr:phage holin family protein [Chthoniobacteraceae bacterium]
MHRFVFRWLVTSLVIALVLHLMASPGEWLTLIASALLLGLLNALVRPLTLRLTQTGLVATTVLAIAALNAGFFAALGSLIPSQKFPSFGSALAGAAIVFVVSWPLTFFFRSSDGHVHAVTHHES